jgi:hypothetical protein
LIPYANSAHLCAIFTEISYININTIVVHMNCQWGPLTTTQQRQYKNIENRDR